MPRRTVKSLQDALRDVERDVEACANKLEQYKEMAQSLRRILAFYGAEAEEQAREEVAPRPREGTSRTAPQEAKLVRNQLYEILRAAERPMHSRDLLTELELRGIEVVGKDPVNNVRSHLSHDPRFVPIGGGKWDLASRANGYQPGWAPATAHRSPPADVAAPPDLPTKDEPPPPDPTEGDWLDDPFTEEDDPFTEELRNELRDEWRQELTHSAF